MIKDTEGFEYMSDLFDTRQPLEKVRVATINEQSKCAVICHADGTRHAISLFDLAGYHDRFGNSHWLYIDSPEIPLVEYKDAMPGYTGKGER